MALTLTIAGVDRTALLRRTGATQPLSIDTELKARSTAAFELYSADGAYRPAIGNIVTITDGGSVTYFAGTIDSVSETRIWPTAALVHVVACVDYNQIPDRRVVAWTYENQAAGTIATDLLNTWLSGEGITAGTIATGPTVTKMVLNYDRLTDALDQLSELSGYSWWIDYSKALHFRPRDAVAAPFSLTTTSGNFRNLRVERTREDYRNRQWLRAGVDITGTQANEAPTPAPDGVSKNFTVKYPIAAAPTIAVDGSTTNQTVGILDADTGMMWYWLKGIDKIVQSTSGTVLGTTATIAVTYTGYYPIVIRKDLEAERTSRASVEGGTGIYEHVKEITDLDSRTSAEEIADGLLRRFGQILTKIQFETDTASPAPLQPGQLLTVSIASHNITATFLIDRVRTFDIGRADMALRYEVHALSGEAI